METTYTRTVARLWLNSVKLAQTSRQWKHYIHLTEVLTGSPKYARFQLSYDIAINRAGAAYYTLLPSIALVDQYAQFLKGNDNRKKQLMRALDFFDGPHSLGKK